MKTGTLLMVSFACMSFWPLRAQTGSSPASQDGSEYSVVERGPHYRVWQRLIPINTPDGQLFMQTNSYVELATGMHVWMQNGWVETSDKIEIEGDEAVGRNGAHQVR